MQTIRERLIESIEWLAEQPAEHFTNEWVLDVEITKNTRGDLLGVVVVTDTGGPHLQLNTRFNRVEGYWGGEEVTMPINESTCEAVIDFYEEVFEL